MAHLAVKDGYHELVDRLNRFPQGAPPTDLLVQDSGAALQRA